MVGVGRRFLCVLSAVVVVLPTTATQAAAYTQSYNNYPGSPTNCTMMSTVWPCLYWATNGSASIAVYVYVDSSLNNVRGVNLTTEVRTAMARYNAVPTRNPGLFNISYVPSFGMEANTSVPGEFYYYEYAATYYSFSMSPGSIGLMDHVWIDFNSDINWNLSYKYNCVWDSSWSSYRCAADAGKVATHEMGHAEGLGHSGGVPTIMKQGAVSFRSLKTDDINGIKWIYR
jgi:hypothetical protein